MCASDVTADLGQFVAMKVGCCGAKRKETIRVLELGL